MILAKFWSQGLSKDTSGFPSSDPRTCTRAQPEVPCKENCDLSTSCLAVDSCDHGSAEEVSSLS